MAAHEVAPSILGVGLSSLQTVSGSKDALTVESARLVALAQLNTRLLLLDRLRLPAGHPVNRNKIQIPQSLFRRS
jgi:hypothetical protein